MAIRTVECPCGERFEGITGGMIAEGVRCPSCGSSEARPIFEVPTRLAIKPLRNWDLASDGDIRDQLLTKADCEAHRDEIHAGTMRVRNPKGLPSALRPDV